MSAGGPAGGPGPAAVVELLALGCRWTLDASGLDPERYAVLARRWARCIELAAAPDALVLDDEPLPAKVDPAADSYDLSRALTRATIERLAGRQLLLHAAALTDETGRAVVLVAPSGGGKSTASISLGRSLGYLSDESVAITAEHEVAAYPKPPSLITDQADAAVKDEPAPDEVGLAATPTRARLGAVLTLRREDRWERPSIAPVGLLDQLVAVIPETSSLWLLPGGLDRLARAVTAAGGAHELRYREITDCLHLVRDHLAAATPVTPTWRYHPPGGDVGTTGGGPTIDPPPEPGPRFARGPWRDAVEAEGEVLLLLEQVPARLGGVGAQLWLACAEPRTTAELLAATVTALGEHPEADALVAGALAALVEGGVLRQV